MLLNSPKSRVLMRGATTISYPSAGLLTTPVDISSLGITNLSRVVERLTGYACSYKATSVHAGILITSPTNMDIYTYCDYAASTTVYVGWEICQAQGSVQRGYTDAAVSSTALVTSNTPISGVPNFAMCKAYNNGGRPTLLGAYSIPNQLQLTSATNLRHYLSANNYSSGFTYRHFWAVDR